MSINMIQLSSREEWLRNRLNGIGGSEISAVIGQNPYMSNQKLYRLKTGLEQAEDISHKPYVEYGTKAEEHLRALYSLDHPEYEVLYVPDNSWTNSKFPWAQASLDGWIRESGTGRKGVWECKTSEPIGKTGWAKWDGKIPTNYYCQVVFYMAVIEADFAELLAQLKCRDGSKITRTYHIERSEVQEDMDYIMQAGADFWRHVVDRQMPALILPEI